jgi:hypothetical protein
MATETLHNRAKRGRHGAACFGIERHRWYCSRNSASPVALSGIALTAKNMRVTTRGAHNVLFLPRALTPRLARSGGTPARRASLTHRACFHSLAPGSAFTPIRHCRWHAY